MPRKKVESKEEEQKKLIIFLDQFSELGGVETHAYNLCYWLRDYFDVTFMYGDNPPAKMLNRFDEIVKTEYWDKTKEYETDFIYRASWCYDYPDNIHAKGILTNGKEGYMEGYHCNPYFILKEPNLWKKAQKLACGKDVARLWEEKYGEKIYPIGNILLPKPEIKKTLHFVICGRIDKYKGWTMTLEFFDKLRQVGIPFKCDIITHSYYLEDQLAKGLVPEEVHLWKARYDNADLVADADYTLLFSEWEGSPMQLRESLQLGVPCIVTDIPGSTELVKDNVNGYVIPMIRDEEGIAHLGEFDVTKLYNIPEAKELEVTTVEDWCNYIGGAVYKKYEHKQKMQKVKVMNGYLDLNGETRHKDEEYECPVWRAKALKESGNIEYV